MNYQSYNNPRSLSNTRSTSSGIIDDEDRPFILRKIWCHGQSALPPIIAICYAAYALHSSNNKGSLVVSCVIIPLLLCTWPFASLKAVSNNSSQHDDEDRQNNYRFLRWGGVLVLMIYVGMFVSVVRHRTEGGLEVLLMIFSGLAAIETAAFLAVVTYMRGMFFY